MIVYGMGQWHQYRRHTGGGDLRHCQRPGPAQHQVGPGVGGGHIIDKRADLDCHTQLLISGLYRLQMLTTALMPDTGAPIGRHGGQYRRQQIVDRLGAQTAAHHQQAQGTPVTHRTLLRCRQLHNIRAHGVADMPTATSAQGDRVALQHDSGQRR